MADVSTSELLQFAVDNGILNLALVQEKLNMQKREELLLHHPYKIWVGKDNKWRTYLPDKEAGRKLIKRNSKKQVEDTVCEYWKTELNNPTIYDVFNEWNDRRLEMKKISCSTHTRNKQIYKRHYSDFGMRKIKAVEQDDIIEFLEREIPNKNLSAKAFSNLKTITRGMLKRAKRLTLIDWNVEELFQELDTSEADFKTVIKEDWQEVFNEDELPIVMNYLEKNPDIKNIGIMIMLVSGIRVGELVTLKYSDFDGMSFKIRRTETKYIDDNNQNIYTVKEFPKSEAGVRQAIIPRQYAWLITALRKLNPFGEYVFINGLGERMTTNCIRSRMRRVCEKVNIFPKSPHKARKTYGSILLDNGLDNKLIISVMGHTDIACTEEHYHRDRKSIDRKIDIISNLPEFMAK